MSQTCNKNSATKRRREKERNDIIVVDRNIRHPRSAAQRRE
jgi:hypothetical protein